MNQKTWHLLNIVKLFEYDIAQQSIFAEIMNNDIAVMLKLFIFTFLITQLGT